MPFVKAGDLNVHHLEQGTGTPVILIHGNWGSCSWWEPVLARLPAGRHGLAYDVRGRGQTEGPDSGYTLPELAADLFAFADALGIDRFDLVGHSLGSAIAMQALLDAPARIRTFTAVAPAWVDGMPEVMNAPAGQEALKADPVLFATALHALAPAAPEDAFWQRLVAEGHAQRMTATLANIDALLAWHPGDALRNSGVPTLVCTGSQDILTGGANAERAAQALNARLVILPGVGHSPIIEAPDAFVALLTEHMQQVP